MVKRKKQEMTTKRWKNYVEYLIVYNQKTDWVLRDHPYPEYHQFPDGKRDFRDEIDDRIMGKIMMEVLMTLTQRERDIIIQRFGIDDGVPKSLDQLAEKHNVCRNRILQLEHKALRKLRHPARTRMLIEPEEYLLKQAKLEEERKIREEEDRIRRIEQEKAENERKERWYAQYYERERQEAIEREERYQERQRKALARVKELEEQKSMYSEMDKQVKQYEEEQARKIAEYQKEQQRPYAWCPRTKTKRYLD